MISTQLSHFSYVVEDSKDPTILRKNNWRPPWSQKELVRELGWYQPKVKYTIKGEKVRWPV